MHLRLLDGRGSGYRPVRLTEFGHIKYYMPILRISLINARIPGGDGAPIRTIDRRQQMKRLLIAAGVLALAATMCIPISVLSDGSDAFDITESENGISWESDTLDEEQINKLFTPGQIEYIAEEALGTVVSSTGSFTISNAKATEAKVTKSMGNKVTGSSITNVTDESVTMKMTFKATVNGANYSIFDNIYLLTDLIRYVKFDNKTTVGAFFEFDVEVKAVNAFKTVNELEQNKEGNYVVVKQSIDSKDFINVKGDVKYTYNDGTADVVREFSVDFGHDFGNKGSYSEYEFDGDVADAKAGDRVLCKDQDLGDVFYIFKLKYDADGSGGDEVDLSDVMELETGSAYSTAVIYNEAALAPETYEFYPSGGTATPLFNTVADPLLASNDALKTYLSEHGTIGESFSDAEDLADSEYGSAKKSHTLLYVGIGVAVVAVVAIAAFVVLRMRQ